MRTNVTFFKKAHTVYNGGRTIDFNDETFYFFTEGTTIWKSAGGKNFGLDFLLKHLARLFSSTNYFPLVLLNMQETISSLGHCQHYHMKINSKQNIYRRTNISTVDKKTNTNFLSPICLSRIDFHIVKLVIINDPV